MRLDFANHDLLVEVTADRRRGVWGNFLFLKNSKPTRTAGQLPTSASAHTLQIVALVNALRNISKGQHSRLMQNVPRGGSKPRVMIVSHDQSFVDGLHAIIAGDIRKIRAGRNFHDIAAKQLMRFTVLAMHDPDPGSLGLLNWATRAVVDPKAIADLPPSLLPTAVSQFAPIEV